MSTTPTSTTISGSNSSLVPSISNLGNGSVYFGVQVFSYEELEEATENFSKELGDGGFGTVYYGKNREKKKLDYVPNKLQTCLLKAYAILKAY